MPYILTGKINKIFKKVNFEVQDKKLNSVSIERVSIKSRTFDIMTKRLNSTGDN